MIQRALIAGGMVLCVIWALLPAHPAKPVAGKPRPPAVQEEWRDLTPLTNRKEKPDPSTLLSRLYRGGNRSELFDFMAQFRVKKNLAGKETTNPDALQDFLKGTIYFKAPDKLRVESLLTASPYLVVEEFVLMRDGVTEWVFKNGVDRPLKKRGDPQESSSYLPFRFQRYGGMSQEIVLLGQEHPGGRLTHVIGITSPQDPDREITKVWIDAEYLVPIRVEYRGERWIRIRENMLIQDNEFIAVKKKVKVKMAFAYKNIRQAADGRWLPTQMESYENGVLTQVVYYDRIAVNRQLPDTLFAPHGGALSSGH